MKKLFTHLIIVFGVLGLGNSNLSAQTGGSVTICHVTGNGSSQMITVSQNALAAHLAHGDALIEDMDGDGYVVIANDCMPGGDCDDHNSNVYPGAVEICMDGLDNNCNSIIDCDESNCAFTSECAPCCFDDILDQFEDGFAFVSYTPYILFPEDQFFGIGIIDFGSQKFCGYQAPDGSTDFFEISTKEFNACATRIGLIATSLNLSRSNPTLDMKNSEGYKKFGFDNKVIDK